MGSGWVDNLADLGSSDLHVGAPSGNLYPWMSVLDFPARSTAASSPSTAPAVAPNVSTSATAQHPVVSNASATAASTSAAMLPRVTSRSPRPSNTGHFGDGEKSRRRRARRR